MRWNMNQDEMKCESRWDKMWIKMKWDVNQDEMSCEWKRKEMWN